MPSGFLFLIISLVLLTCSKPPQNESSEVAFYGTDSRRTTMLFQSKVRYTLSEQDRNKDLNELKKLYLDQLIETQLAHLYGVFTQHTRPVDFTSNPGIPRERPEISNIAIKRLNANMIEVSYSYEDVTVFLKDFIKRQHLTEKVKHNGKEHLARPIAFYLPLEPGLDGSEIYRKGCPDQKMDHNSGLCTDHNLNHCTDLHYNSVGDFWYFWNPFQGDNDHESGCLINIDRDLIKISAYLIPINSTGIENQTYPDYYRLYGEAKSSKKTIKVTLLTGIDDSFRKDDLGKKTFGKTYDLLTLGSDAISKEQDETCKDLTLSADERPYHCLYTTGELKLFEYFKTHKDEDIRMLDITDDKDRAYKLYDEHIVTGSLTKNRKYLFYQNDELNYQVIVKMQLINPQNEDSVAELGTQGLTNSDVFIYDGHSGLGGYFHVDNFFFKGGAKMRPGYQILFFNGCSTFSYYNLDYFEKKHEQPQDINTLDVITTAIGADFVIGAGTDAYFIKNLINGKKSSWHKVIDGIYDIEPTASALTHINGDEMNPRRPRSDGSCYKDFVLHKESGFCRPINEHL